MNLMLFRRIEYVLVNLRIMFGLLQEYRGNMLTQIFSQVVFLFSYFVLYSVIVTKLAIIDWSIVDFFFYILIIDIVVTFVGIFNWKGEGVQRYILSGFLNQFIARPISPFFGFNFSNLNANAFTQFIINLVFLVFFVFFLDFDYDFGLWFWIMLLTISFFYHSMKKMCESFTFVNFYFARFLHFDLFKSTGSVLKAYPSGFFGSFKYKFLLQIFPNFYFGSLLFVFMKGSVIAFYQFYILLLVTFIFTIISLINWHYGLKNYEAFG